MKKRGQRPKGNIKIKWSPKFAYAIGLIVTDGNLSEYGGRISFVSKDIEQIENFRKCLNIKNKIGIHNSGSSTHKSFRVQFRDILFFDFLNNIGIFPTKSKTIKSIKIPERYFFDYLRGCFDGDGCFYSYWDPRWRSSHMFYIEFISASHQHISWLRKELKEKINVIGYITKEKKKSTYQLKYAKKESLEIIKRMYYNRFVVCLGRKYLKIQKAIKTEKKQQRLYLLR